MKYIKITLLLLFLCSNYQSISSKEIARKWYLLHRNATPATYTETQKAFAKIIKQNKNNEYAYYERALFYYKFHKDSLSLLDISKSIELNPSKQLFYLFRAVLLIQLEKYELAINDIHKLDKTDAETNYLYGKYFLHLDSINQAFTYFDNAISIVMQNHTQLFIQPSNFYYYRGKLHFAMNRYENAIQDFTIALSRVPKFKKDNIYMLRANVYNTIHQTDDFKRDVDSAFAINSDSFTLAYLYALSGNTTKTEELIHTFFSTDSNTSCHKKGLQPYHIACLYAILNKKEIALAYLEKALQQGYDKFNWIMIDFDMRNIKEDPTFIQLIKKYQSTVIK